MTGCETYHKTGRMMPEDGIDQVRNSAIYLGAVGYPGSQPYSLGLLMRSAEFHQYVNLRPCRLFHGVPCPLVDRGPGDIDMMIVRENVERILGIGGRLYRGLKTSGNARECFTRKAWTVS